MHSAIIGLGSNIEAQRNIEKAKALLAKDLKIIAESRFLITKPLGKSDQADFLNGAILIETNLNVEELKDHLKTIETSLGRVKADNDFGPRTIDLDILVWGNKIIKKDFYERDFVRTSVLELKPQLKF